MTKRKLDKTELSIAKSNLERLENELKYSENVELRRLKLSIEVAPLEYSKQVNEMMKNKRILESQIKELRSSIRILKTQISEGVDSEGTKTE